MKWIRRFDFFGYIPSFRIDGKKELKSIFGGVSTLALIILSLSYISYSIDDYVKNFNNISTSRIVTNIAQNYTLKAIDAYYGVGFTDKNGNYINISQFDFLNIYFQYIIFNKTTQQSIINTVPFERCQRDIFIPDIEFNQKNEKQKKIILNNLKYYICPKENFTYELFPYDFSTDDYSISIKLDLNKNWDLNSIQSFLENFSPTLNFLYQQYTINSDSKFKPYYQNIGCLSNELGFYFSKTIQLYLNPYDILDDLNPIGNGVYQSLDQKEFSSQPNATIFQTTRWADYFRFYPNRDTSINKNTSDLSELNLMKINISLGSLKTTTYRTYRKFNDFVAGVSSIISNSFVAVAVVVTYINTIKGNNNMIRSLYDKERILELNELNKKFKSISISQRSKQKYSFDKTIKKISNQNKGNALIGGIIKAKLRKNSIKIIQKETESQGNLIRVKTKIENKIDNMLNDDINFTFKQYFKSKLCSKKKSYQLIENALQNIEQLLDINTYMKFKLEMELVKQVLFDENQKTAFDILSSLLNFNRLFDVNDNSLANKTNLSENLVNSLKFLYSRSSETDQKILAFIRQILAR